MSQSVQHLPLAEARALAEAALPRLRIFPLPGGVLLPGAAVPLHVFEPRYRVMLADTRAGDHVLALASLLAPETADDPGAAVHLTVGVGLLVYDQLMPDGRSVILVRGLLRARIEEELRTELPYRVVRARLLRDTPSPAGELQATTAITRHLVRDIAHRVKPEEGAEKLLELVTAETNAGQLADLVGSVFLTRAEQRQSLLEELSPLRRLDRVNDHLAGLLSDLDGPVPGGITN